jgi:VanZ family protein
MFKYIKRAVASKSIKTWLATGWTLLIFVLCWMPKSSMPTDEDGPSSFYIPHFDKIVHFAIFAGFAVLWRRASGRGSALAIAVSGLALAVITELGQGTVIVGRDAEFLDGLADFAGVVLGLAVAFWIERRGAVREAVRPAQPVPQSEALP